MCELNRGHEGGTYMGWSSRMVVQSITPYLLSRDQLHTVIQIANALLVVNIRRTNDELFSSADTLYPHGE